MKRVLYIVLAVGLAASLAGCGESSGGYWPGNPAAAPAGNDGVTILGNNNVAVAQNLFVINNNQDPAAMQIMQNSLNNGCPMLPTLGGDFKLQPFASIMGSSRSKTRTAAESAGASELADVVSSTEYSGYYKFEYSYSNTLIPESSHNSQTSIRKSTSCSCPTYPTITYSYLLYIMFLDATGNIIPLNSTSEYWYQLPSNVVVDQVKCFGQWQTTIKSSDGKYNWTDTTNIGTPSTPWWYKDLSTTEPLIQGKMTVQGSGTLDGQQAQNFEYATQFGGSDGFFHSPSQGWPCGTYSFTAQGFSTIYTFDGTSVVRIAYSPSAPAGAPTFADMAD